MIFFRLFGNGGFGANLLPVLIGCRLATKDIHILLLFLKILVYDTILQQEIFHGILYFDTIKYTSSIHKLHEYMQ